MCILDPDRGKIKEPVAVYNRQLWISPGQDLTVMSDSLPGLASRSLDGTEVLRLLADCSR